MPVEQRSGSSQIRAVTFGLVALIVALSGLWAFVAWAGRGDGPVQLRLGDDVFNAGQAERLSAQVASEGPLLFSDVSGRGQVQPIYVAHFGDDPRLQWSPVSAVAPGASEGCFLVWSAERNLYEERANVDGAGRQVGELCRDVTWSADGSSGSDGSALEVFPWRVDAEGNLVIDLRTPEEQSTNTSTP